VHGPEVRGDGRARRAPDAVRPVVLYLVFLLRFLRCLLLCHVELTIVKNGRCYLKVLLRGCVALKGGL